MKIGDRVWCIEKLGDPANGPAEPWEAEICPESPHHPDTFHLRCCETDFRICRLREEFFATRAEAEDQYIRLLNEQKRRCRDEIARIDVRIEEARVLPAARLRCEEAAAALLPLIESGLENMISYEIKVKREKHRLILLDRLSVEARVRPRDNAIVFKILRDGQDDYYLQDPTSLQETACSTLACICYALLDQWNNGAFQNQSN